MNKVCLLITGGLLLNQFNLYSSVLRIHITFLQSTFQTPHLTFSLMNWNGQDFQLYSHRLSAVVLPFETSASGLIAFSEIRYWNYDDLIACFTCILCRVIKCHSFGPPFKHCSSLSKFWLRN